MSGAPRHTQQFRSARPRLCLSPDQKRRQAVVAAESWRALGDRDRVIAFLNQPDAELGGRPLDLATDGNPGLDAVVARLAALANSGA